jgi:hypothetical protein
MGWRVASRVLTLPNRPWNVSYRCKFFSLKKMRRPSCPDRTIGFGWDGLSWDIKDNTTPEQPLMRPKHLLSGSEISRTELSDCTYGLPPFLINSVGSYSTLYSTDRTTMIMEAKVPKSRIVKSRESLHDAAPSRAKVLCNILWRKNRNRMRDLKLGLKEHSSPFYITKAPKGTPERVHNPHLLRGTSGFGVAMSPSPSSTKTLMIACPNAPVSSRQSSCTAKETPDPLRL